MEPIHELLQSRHSPRSFDDAPVSRETVRALVEAARWAPSSYNDQPWRFIVATKDDPAEFDRLLQCLVPGNQAWAKEAYVLMLSVASLRFSQNDKPNRHAYHDVGLAVSQMILEASSRGLRVRQMAGFDVDAARRTYSIPDGFDPVAAIAIGHSSQEPASTRSRKAHDEIAFAGEWGRPF